MKKADYYYETPDGVNLKILQFNTDDNCNIGGLFFKKTGNSQETAMLVLHGIASEFYSSVPGFLGPGLALEGYDTLSLNTRNHGTQYQYSLFESCLSDIKAAIDGLQKREGYKDIILVGHSLGCTEIVYYMAKTNDPRVKAIVLLGAHLDLKGSTWHFFKGTDPDNPKKEYEKYLKECEKLVSEGKGENLLIRPHSLAHPNLNLPQQYISESAQTFISYRNSESDCSIAKWIESVKVPIFLPSHEIVTTFASPEFSRKIKEAAVNSPRCDDKIIKGVGHSYEGKEQETIDSIVGWVKSLNVK